jgi:epidermal growth factor receptor substrate 15
MKNFITLSFILLFTSLSFSQLDEQKKLEFSKKMKDGDMLFSQGKFLDAKRYYEEAATINPNDEQVKKQIKFCDSNEQKKSGFEADKEYNKLINKADEKFKSGDYQGSKDLFLRAKKIKTSDTYPPKMLRQIEDLLNPKTIIKAEPLPDLGQSSEMSIEEAQKALKAADIDRKNLRNTGVINQTDALSKTENELAANRLKEMESSGVNFSEVKKRIDSLNQVDIHAKDTVNIKLQHEDNSVTSVIKFQQTYQRDLLGFVDQTLINKTKINDSINTKNAQIGSNNDTIFFNRIVKNEYVDAKNLEKNELSKTDTKQTISVFESTEQKKFADNIISNEEVIELVNETNENINDLDIKLVEKNKKNTNNTFAKNVEFSKKDENSSTVTSKSIIGNNKSLESINRQNLTIEDSLLISPEKKRNQLKDSLDSKYYYYENNFSEKTNLNRNESINQVKVSNQEIQKQIDEIENSQISTRQDHVLSIFKLENQKINSDDSLSQIENISIKKLNILTKKNEDKISNINDLDIKEINNTATGLTNLETETDRFNSQGITKTSDSKSSLENIQDRIENSKKIDAENRINKTLEAKGIIEDIEKKGRIFDEKSANSIGSLYPEGVSQEQFNKTDNKGSLLAVVTRRVVVKNGYGQIYTRTQTKDYITYSKNGAASTEVIWQRETQDTKLKKN